MSVISSGTTLTTALVQTGDTNGNLVFKTGASGTTALTLGSDQSATFAGAVSFSGGAFAAGSAGAPSITFTGDTNTGIFSPAADTIAFTEGGVESMRIDSAGNVGIGRAPNYQLDVYRTGTTNTTVAAANDNIVNILQVSGNTAGVVGTITSHPLIITAANTERIRINTIGNVGIGTSSPVQRLQVQATKGNTDNDSTGQMAVVDNTAFNSSPIAGIQFGVKYNNSGTLVTGTSIQGFKENATDGNFAQALRFTTQANGDSPRERMRIDSSGNVGIGTSSPSYKLHVVGGQTRLDVSSAGTSLVCLGTGSNFQVDHSTSGYATLINSANSGAAMIFKGSSESMRIDSSGNLLVGTTSQIGDGKVSIVSNAGISLRGDSGSANSGDIIFWRGDNNARSWGLQTNKDNLFISDDNFSNYAYLAQNPTQWLFASDARIKKNIQDLNYGLDEVMAIKPCSFDYIATNKHDIGFIAQELKDIIPEAVSGEELPFYDADTPQERANKTLGVGKETLIPVLVKAIQEQQAIITDQASTIAAFEARLTALENK